MNAQFRKNTDPAIAKLIDPARGFAFTCVRCNKHMKEEATSAHVCEGDRITVQGVDFTRDASMRYRCQVCNVTVPIVLVRAHAVRHPKTSSLQEEEWNDLAMVEKFSKQVPKQPEVRANPPPPSIAVGGPVLVAPPAAPQLSAVLQQPVIASPQVQPSEGTAASLGGSPVKEIASGPSICPQQSSEMQVAPKKRRRKEVTYCLRKVRKVELALDRVCHTFMRAVFVAKFRAFRRWLKLSKK